MKLKNPFRELTPFELFLWIGSLMIIIISFIVFSGGDFLSLTASLIGVTGLIFVAKGHVVGQFFTIIFAVFYGIISLFFCYYGEMITYLGMSLPIAVIATISWIRHPFRASSEVEVSRMTVKKTLVMLLVTSAVTVAFYFILKALGTAELLFSTVSITTSFLASYLSFLRSPYYAVAYAFNDIVLIVLWSLAAHKDASSFPMIICFSLFLINDIYGFINWQRMKKRQAEQKK